MVNASIGYSLLATIFAWPRFGARLLWLPVSFAVIRVAYGWRFPRARGQPVLPKELAIARRDSDRDLLPVSDAQRTTLLTELLAQVLDAEAAALLQLASPPTADELSWWCRPVPGDRWRGTGTELGVVFWPEDLDHWVVVRVTDSGGRDLVFSGYLDHERDGFFDWPPEDVITRTWVVATTSAEQLAEPLAWLVDHVVAGRAHRDEHRDPRHAATPLHDISGPTATYYHLRRIHDEHVGAYATAAELEALHTDAHAPAPSVP